MLVIACCRIGVSVRESVWVENPDIKEGSLISATPKSVCRDVQPCAILCIGRGT